MVRRIERALQRRIARWLDPLGELGGRVVEVRGLEQLLLAMGWQRRPVLRGEHLRAFRGIEDLHERRMRDAEVIGAACANEGRKILLEIGTGRGLTTALMAENAPHATVHTVNIPPDEIVEGGRFTTFAPSLDEIGSYVRERQLSNVAQIFANTAQWEPDFGPLDVAFIDGCHDADFVYHDTRKVLAHCREGAVILWHDFHPGLVRVYPWIGSVAAGIDRLFRDGLLRGRVLHLQDSWVGLYRVPAAGARA
jgi:predicted O-methyltransferase YrrM